MWRRGSLAAAAGSRFEGDVREKGEVQSMPKDKEDRPLTIYEKWEILDEILQEEFEEKQKKKVAKKNCDKS